MKRSTGDRWITAFWASFATVFYAYLGYPMLLAILSRVLGRDRTFVESTDPPVVALLIAAHDEELVIGRKLEESLALDYPPGRLRIVVASDGSTDETARIVEGFRHRGVVSSHAPQRAGKTAAITRAMISIDSEIVVFSDANNRYDKGSLRALVGPFGDPQVGAVTGSKAVLGEDQLGQAEGLYWKYEDLIKRAETRLGSCTAVAGEILAIRRSLWEEPPPAIINDDFWIAARIIRRGYDVVYEPRARSTEHVSGSAQDEITRRTRIIAGRYQAMRLLPNLLPIDRPLVAWQMISHKFVRPIVPFAMIGMAVANLLALRHRSYPDHVPTGPRSIRLLLVGQAAFYGSAWLGHRFRAPGPIGRILYIPTFLVDSNLAALVGLGRHLRGRQSAAWQRVARRE